MFLLDCKNLSFIYFIMLILIHFFFNRCLDLIQSTKVTDSPPITPHPPDQSDPIPIASEIIDPDKPKRRLRSSTTKTDDSDCHESIGKDNCVASVASTSSGRSTPHPTLSILKSILPLNIGIPVEGRDMLKNILSWEILPKDSLPEPSMIYGAVHLARLIGNNLFIILI